MSAARPSVAEERALAVAERLRGRVPREALASWTGGWKIAGPIARVALFALGTFAVGLLFALVAVAVRADLDASALVAGLAAVAAGEALIRARRLHASGVEEALVAVGAVVAAFGVLGLAGFDGGADEWRVAVFLLAAALAVAGWRLSNPFLTTLAATLGVVGVTLLPGVCGVAARHGAAVPLLVAGLAVLAALAVGAREYERPSRDRMLDWLVVALPALAYAATGFDGGIAGDVCGDGTSAVHDRGATQTAIVAAALALLLLAVVLAVVGLRRRRHAPLYGALANGVLGAGLLQGTLGVDPAIYAIVVGAAVLTAALVLDRALRGPRRGLTSARLDDDPESPLDLVQASGAAIAAHGSQAAQPTPGGRGFEGGGGRYDGGGASGSF